MKTVVLGVGRMGRRHIQAVKEMGLDLIKVCKPSPVKSFVGPFNL